MIRQAILIERKIINCARYQENACRLDIVEYMQHATSRLKFEIK